MIRACAFCKQRKEMTPRQKYCDAKCKKNHENSKRTGPVSGKPGQPFQVHSGALKRPQGLNPVAAEYWDRVAPTVIARGHLNVLSVDAFAELCDLYSRLSDVNAMINNGTVIPCEECGAKITTDPNRALLQVEDKWDNSEGTETRAFKESALSDLKRKYSRAFLEYQKQFYLTPMANRGNFGLPEKPEKPKNDFDDLG